MRSIVFTNARDEYLINEWIAHYLLLDFTTVYVYDHLSVTPIRQTASAFLSSPLFKDRVIVEEISRSYLGKDKVILNAYRYAKDKGYDWAMYIDADEFLYLKDHDSISQYVEWFLSKEPSTLQIGFPWVMFGSNHHDTPPANNIMDSFIKSAKTNFDHVKTICFVKKIDLSNAVVPVPHFLVFQDYILFSFLTDFNHLVPVTSWKFPKQYDTLTLDSYLAHYQNQSYETYLHRKVLRNRDDCPKINYPRHTPSHFHTMFNDITNTLVRDKYADNIQKLLSSLTTVD